MLCDPGCIFPGCRRYDDGLCVAIWHRSGVVSVVAEYAVIVYDIGCLIMILNVVHDSERVL